MADFGGQKTAVTIAVLQGLADAFLADSISLRRVDEGDALIDRRLFIHFTHATAKGPGPAADDRYFRSFRSQLSVFHRRLVDLWCERIRV